MDIASSLRQTAIFQDASDDVLQRLTRAASTARLERDQALWQAGDPSSFFTVLQNGLVKIVRPLPNGREAILGLFGPKESVGDVAVLQGIAFPAAAIVCTAQAQVIRIPRDAVLEEMKKSAPLALRLSQCMGQRVKTFHTKVDILSAGNVEARLAALLMDLAERFGDDFDDGTMLVPIALSRQDLASLVSTSFETAIRIMSRWQKQALVETRPDGFLLRSPEQLQTIARSVSGTRAGD